MAPTLLTCIVKSSTFSPYVRGSYVNGTLVFTTHLLSTSWHFQAIT